MRRVSTTDPGDPWPAVFDLMWEAYTAGTIPVGAVVTDESGSVVSRARNRIFDEGGAAPLHRSRLAHAELNALAALTSDRTYEGYTLFTSLEPCHLCLSGAIAVRVGAVQYAAQDPYAGAVGKLLPSADHEAHEPVRVVGPLSGPHGRLPELLHVAHFLWRAPGAQIMGFYRRTRPEVVAQAASLPAPDAGATLADAYAAL
jgi:tRNA(adenine34) deaminase